MGWSGGNYTKGNAATGGWVGDASLGIGIEAGRHDTQDNDFATGINQCLNKDGSNAATGNLNLGGFLPTNLGAGTAAAPALCMNNDTNTGFFSAAADQIGVATNGTEKIRIDANGKVGIGTASPAANLDIQGTATKTTTTRFSNDLTGPIHELQKSRGTTIGTNTIVQNGDILGALVFNGANGTSYTEGAYVAAFVDGTPGASNDMPTRLIFATTADGAGIATERLRIQNDGKLLINTNSHTQADLLVSSFNGSVVNGICAKETAGQSGAYFAVWRNSAGVECGSVARVTTTNAVNYNTSSDYRLKTNVAPLVDVLSRVMQLRPVSFDWADGQGGCEGFLAHEVAAVLPYAVSGEKDGTNQDGTPRYQGVDYGKLTIVLTAAIQELSNKLDAAEARIAALES